MSEAVNQDGQEQGEHSNKKPPLFVVFFGIVIMLVIVGALLL